MIELRRKTGNQPYPPKFVASRHPAGTIVRVIAERTQLSATYESTGHVWKRIDPNAAPRPPE
jgi:hypothetical protein